LRLGLAAIKYVLLDEVTEPGDGLLFWWRVEGAIVGG
jgi:hypothetical protein